jgi:hypothetical protein
MGSILGIVGGLLIFVGWIWLIITAFTKGGALWGILAILFSWITGLIFYFTKKEGLQPTLVILGGIVLTIIARMM